jgi:hypothetical protein
MRLPAVCLFVVPMWMAAGSRPAATPETDRIQTREDGVSIDQIVIGSAKHLSAGEECSSRRSPAMRALTQE